MTSREIIDLAIEYRMAYNSRDAKYITDRLGIKIAYMQMKPDAFKAHIVQLNNYQPIITLNSNYTEESQNVLCAHELGHFLLHSNCINHFDSANSILKQKMEYEANLFAVAFLYNESDFNWELESMSNYSLMQILESNLVEK